ncbi:hypothetical protein F892_02336 [Acinetobacter vivianii]|uniref:HNH nuclease domain-containing protein n=1 Tax=Acinetobacter vivianii TaxID=1776742 RepID=N9NQ04_9GAMM|nr:hypothetical protein [Acinetobacter vivianii]ENX23093.1 hypothetical protein F892_02336 [Acinetobacter vivianii]GGI60591.1 hypothetical protein GCM10011446_20860 [Acinetobacter vivianii]
MLKPINNVTCSPALVACQHLIQRFALWLCNPTTIATHINQQSLQPPILASNIEADWLWKFLQRVHDKKSLLSRAEIVASMPLSEKQALANWIRAVSNIPALFQTTQDVLIVNCPIATKSNWDAFKVLMDAFYEKAFRSGLPYLPDGTPTAADGVDYAHFVKVFRNIHRLNQNAHAREICVLCGGPLGDTPHVDHWINKATFPILSVCANNLLLICSICNEAPNKADKPVHSAGSFDNWFHPYLRPGNRILRPKYVLHQLSVKCSATPLVDKPKAITLDALLNLSKRWTCEFKAEYAKHKDILIRREQRRIQKTGSGHTQDEILSYIQDWQEDLSVSQPHYEIHQTLAAALQEPTRLSAWYCEIKSIT